MLRRLSIGNIALIDQLDMTFYDGFSVMTGETGAGKSIIIEALNFVLGERASRELIQSGAAKAYAEATFTLAEGDAVQAVMEEFAIEADEGELTLYRELTAGGKNVCRANGILITANILKRIGDALVDIHGQHAHQSLLNPKLHIDLLDAFAGERILPVKERVRAMCRLAQETARALQSAEMDERERERRIDLLTYQVKEIDEAKLTDGEEETLTEQRGILQNAQSIMDALEIGAEALNGEEGALSAMSAAQRALDAIAPFHSDYADAADKLREAYYALEDTAYAVRDMRNGFSYEPKQLDEIEWRLEQLTALKRKYGASIAEVLAYREESVRELELLEGIEERREKLTKANEAAQNDYRQAAQALTEIRQETAALLKERLLPELNDLGMPHAAFAAEVTESGTAIAPNGSDNVEFLLSTNRGEPLKPLSRVASGGEISRIMLAFKSVLSDLDGIPTMVFDEIDSGISGRIGTDVAVKMRQIAKRHQVLCITHLPQIAAYANRQYLVFKQTDGTRTHTDALLLDDERRASEIARIMGSAPDDAVALQHARQLMEAARA